MHDTFVSYSHLDREWVMNTFVPRLRRAGLNVHTDEEFAKGSDPAKSMALAVLESRCTVVVITRNWIASEWGNFEGNVAAHADRLFSVLREPCTPPATMAKKICGRSCARGRGSAEC
jgi:hypothetical protein